jgi:hypothetical protein
MTFAPEATVTEAFIPALRERVGKRGGQLRFIELRCSPAELEVRIKDDSRLRFGKLRDVKLFRKLEEDGAFDRPKMPEAELVVDTTDAIPLDSARTIVKHLQKSATPRKAP